MRLTIDEFKTIRPIQWVSRMSNDDRIYYKPANETSAILFNLDLLRYVIAPKFSNQNAVVDIHNVDITVPTIMRPDLTVELPTVLETALYFAEQQKENQTDNSTTLFTNVSLNMTLAISLFVYSCVLIFMFFMGKCSESVQKVFSNRII